MRQFNRQSAKDAKKIFSKRIKLRIRPFNHGWHREHGWKNPDTESLIRRFLNTEHLKLKTFFHFFRFDLRAQTPLMIECLRFSLMADR